MENEENLSVDKQPEVVSAANSLSYLIDFENPSIATEVSGASTYTEEERLLQRRLLMDVISGAAQNFRAN